MITKAGYPLSTHRGFTNILDGYTICFSYTNSTPYVIWFQGFSFFVFYMGQEMPLKISIGIFYNTAKTMLD